MKTRIDTHMDTRAFLRATFGANLTHDLPFHRPKTADSAFASHSSQIASLLDGEGKASLFPYLSSQNWQVPVVATAQPDFAANALFVEFYGPEITPELPDFRAGLFFMAPGFFYGAHAHAARETYVRLGRGL